MELEEVEEEDAVDVDVDELFNGICAADDEGDAKEDELLDFDDEPMCCVVGGVVGWMPV